MYTYEEDVCIIWQTSVCDPDQSNVGDFHPNHLDGYISFWNECPIMTGYNSLCGVVRLRCGSHI